MRIDFCLHCHLKIVELTKIEYYVHNKTGSVYCGPTSTLKATPGGKPWREYTSDTLLNDVLNGH